MAIKRSRNHLLNKANSINKYDGKVADILKDIIRSSPNLSDEGVPSTIGHHHDERYYLKSYIDSNYYTAAYISANYSLLGHTHNSFEIIDFNEAVDDRVSALIQNGTGLTWSYNDILGTYTPSVSLSPFNTDQLTPGAINLYTTVAEKSNWNAAFGWGNHALFGYLTSESDTLSTVISRGSTTTLGATFYSATRPISINAGGNITIQGDAGGWNMGYFFKGNVGTIRGGFGALGGLDSLSYYYIGNSYDDYVLKANSNYDVEISRDLYISRNLISYGTASFSSTVTLSTLLTINDGYQYHKKGGYGYWTDGMYSGYNYEIYNTNYSRLDFSIHQNTGKVTITNGLDVTNGNIQLYNNFLQFDEVGIRSWNIRATGGRLEFNSGDHGGYYQFDGSLQISSTDALLFNDYGGGFYMQDTYWVRTYAGKGLWTDGGMLASQGGLSIGYGGLASGSGGAIIAGNVGIGTSTPDIFGRYYDKILGINSATGIAKIELNGASYSGIDFGQGGYRYGEINATSSSFDIGTISTQNLSFHTNGVTRIIVDYLTGASNFSSSITANYFIKSGGLSSQFLKADGSIDSNAYATLTDLNGYIKNGVVGDWQIYSATNNSSYGYATLELYSSYTTGYGAPRLSFHWGGTVASQIDVNSSGTIRFLNGGGSGYQNTIASNYNAEANFINTVSGYGISNSANSNSIFSHSSPYWAIRSGLLYGGIMLQDNTGTLKGYYYFDNDGVGLLNSAGSWSVRLNPGTQGGQLYGGWYSASSFGASYFYDTAIGGYNVNLGSAGSEGRGLVAGFSGGSYGGIGYNVRHTTTGGSYIAPGGDTSNYLLFNQGFTFYGETGGIGGRTLSFIQLARLGNAGDLSILRDITAGSNIWAGNKIVAGPVAGFFNINYVSGFNNIWAFHDAQDYGIGYKQGSTGWYSNDTIRIDVSGALRNISAYADFEVGDNIAWINGNMIWHVGNDGPGSGLHADLLDGQEGSYYYPAYNPNGYISSYSETDTLQSVTSRGNLTTNPITISNRLYTRRAQSNNDYTTAALWTESYDATTTGIAFHISGILGRFLEMRTSGVLYWANEQVWYAGNLDAPNKYGTTNYQTASSMQFLSNTYSLIWPSGAGTEIKPTTRTYGSFGIYGAKGGSVGLPYEIGNIPTWMFDASSNGGLYYQATGLWALFYEYSTGNWMINNASGSNLVVHSGNIQNHTYTKDELDTIHNGHATFKGNANAAFNNSMDVWWTLESSPNTTWNMYSNSEIEAQEGGTYQITITVTAIAQDTLVYGGMLFEVFVNNVLDRHMKISIADDTVTASHGATATISLIKQFASGDKLKVAGTVLYEAPTGGAPYDWQFENNGCAITITKLQN